MTETIGVISIKGGVGKTTTIVNLAATFVKNYNKKVLLIDGNISAPNVGLHLGIAEPKYSIHDVLGDKILAKEAVHEHQYGFDIIPGSLDIKKVDPFKLKHKIKGLTKKYDLVLIDSSPTLNNELIGVMKACNKLFVVTTPDLITVKMTAHATKIAKEKGTPILGIILNKSNKKRYETKIEKIERLAQAPVIATIKNHLKILESVSKVKPLVLNHPNSKPAREYRKLAAAMLDEEYKEPSRWTKIKNHFKEDYSNFKNHKFKKSLKYYK